MTAINAATHSALVHNSPVFFLQDACAALFEELILEVQGGESLTDLPGNGESMSSSFILVIDGRTLGWALEDELRNNFLELSRQCKAVICCRSTPLQKSQVVQLIRDHLGVMTLAVGKNSANRKAAWKLIVYYSIKTLDIILFLLNI